MCMLGVLRMHIDGVGWCVGGCESVGSILVIGGISMVRVSHCDILTSFHLHIS